MPEEKELDELGFIFFGGNESPVVIHHVSLPSPIITLLHPTHPTPSHLPIPIPPPQVSRPSHSNLNTPTQSSHLPYPPRHLPPYNHALVASPELDDELHDAGGRVLWVVISEDVNRKALNCETQAAQAEKHAAQT
ncbi:hypothetical protein NEOLEDRAFT_1245700 [Neolentinus lepideus HHB14362 ss-1]|uniref:Uncharacterized protein n=1 Tax=Neolentinus lepideus HHB14362 ss-1 TaxID=1314782 RepID=A0A165NGT4_9AGAM|nr:hypothetical protein NEOLEDRAFT_1245700 [Neolentinus lepideus HHB14362 ss-1]